MKRDTLALEAEIESNIASMRKRLAGTQPPDIRNGARVKEVLDENFGLAIESLHQVRNTVQETSPQAQDARLTVAGQVAGLGFAAFPLGFGPIDMKAAMGDGTNYFSDPSAEMKSAQETADANPGYVEFMQAALKKPGCGDLVGDRAARRKIRALHPAP